MGRNHFSSIERYHEYDRAIQELMASILSGIAEKAMIDDESRLHEPMCRLSKLYPFVDLLYTLDPKGIQMSSNVACVGKHIDTGEDAKYKDRSQRPYFISASKRQGIVVTEPYLSSATGKLCITAVQALRVDDTLVGYLALDIDLGDTICFLMGDESRNRFVPFFSGIYAVISLGLFFVVLVLLILAAQELSQFIRGSVDQNKMHLKPFSVIIYLTLGLAIFDLAKTILEEEVLMHKDIFRHSSTRRTITRFIAAILIAVSIEALLLMFKSALGGGDQIYFGVLMMFAAIGLLIGLGIYVYLGAKAEQLMVAIKERK